MIKPYVRRMRGQKRDCTRHSPNEIFWSGIGAFISIYALYLFNQYLGFSSADRLYLISSFGASTILVYGVPQADYAQPRNVVGGHLISAFIGISIYNLMPEQVELASALTVSLSLMAMHLTSTIHPPGGGTGLLAVIGSGQIHNLGYQFIFYPVLTSVVFLLALGLIFNNISRNPNRHYPKFWY